MSFPWANHYEPKHPLTKWIDERLPLPRLVYNAVGAGYPVPRNLNYFWNFGVLSGLALVLVLAIAACGGGDDGGGDADAEQADRRDDHRDEHFDERRAGLAAALDRSPHEQLSS